MISFIGYKGFFEITNSKSITDEQTELIKRHLNLVFKHEIDPSMGNEEHQNVLNEIHQPTNLPFQRPPDIRCLKNEKN